MFFLLKAWTFAISICAERTFLSWTVNVTFAFFIAMLHVAEYLKSFHVAKNT